MKKTCCFTIIAILLASGCAFADGNAFTPLNFDDTAYSIPTTNSTSSGNKPATNTLSINDTSKSLTNSSMPAVNGTGNLDLQNAITKIDTALEAIKSEQNVCNSKYADVDNQYKFIKNERTNLKKQVKANDKRIKELNKAKEKLGKNVI